MRNRTSDLQILHSDDALPLSHRDYTVSEVYYKVHMTCVRHTARIRNVNSIMFGNRLREVVNFVLSKDIERCFSSCQECGTKKNSEKFKHIHKVVIGFGVFE